jgi:hypothetical protein
VETRRSRNRRLAAALVTLGLATSCALTGWAMKTGAEEPDPLGLRLVVATRILENPAGATVQFHTGQHGRLRSTDRDFQYHLTLARVSVERHAPVGIRLARTGEILEMRGGPAK